MKPVVILLVLASLGFGGWYWYSQGQGKFPAQTEAQGSEERSKTAVAETRDIRFTVSAAGEITPAEQVSVRPEINGRIETLTVDIGDTIKKGDVFFTLDDRDLQIEKETRQKDIERAKVEMDQAERTYLRNKQLYEEKLVSLEVFEKERTNYELKKNFLSTAEKAMEQAVDKLGKTRIVAPFDCTILTRPVSVGQAVSGSAGFNSGTEVLTVADLSQLIINAHINQADITRLRVNQEVEVAVEAIQGLKVTGVVERIAPQATIKNNIKGFSARILLKDVDPRIRPSMTANIKIPVSSADQVLAVPLAAVFTELNPDTQQMERFVYVKNDSGYERRTIQVGVSDYFFAEIQKGLSAGEVVTLEEPKEEAEKRTKGRTASTSPAPTSTPAVKATPAVAPSTTKTNAARTVSELQRRVGAGS
jgi:RND family efflux transporter MFP subunit